MTGEHDVSNLLPSDAVELDISKGITLMDGLRAHEVANYTGDRFSLIFFTRKGGEGADGDALKTLESCLFPIPALVFWLTRTRTIVKI